VYLYIVYEHVPIEEQLRHTVCCCCFSESAGKSCPALLILRPEPMTAIRRSVGKRSAEHDFNLILCQFLWMSESKDDSLWGQGRKGQSGGRHWVTKMVAHQINALSFTEKMLLISIGYILHLYNTPLVICFLS